MKFLIELNPVVKSKSKVNIPDGVYVGRVGGSTLTILSQDQYGKKIPLEFGIRTMDLAVVVLIDDGISYCFDKGFRMS